MLQLDSYTSEERSIAQLKAIELKKKGYFITRILNKEENLTAIGYKKSDTSIIKKSNKLFFFQCSKEDFDFIYWN